MIGGAPRSKDRREGVPESSDAELGAIDMEAASSRPGCELPLSPSCPGWISALKRTRLREEVRLAASAAGPAASWPMYDDEDGEEEREEAEEAGKGAGARCARAGGKGYAQAGRPSAEDPAAKDDRVLWLWSEAEEDRMSVPQSLRAKATRIVADSRISTECEPCTWADGSRCCRACHRNEGLKKASASSRSSSHATSHTSPSSSV